MSGISYQGLLQMITLVLIIFTSYLSYGSYKFQIRAAIRESLEQLDDIELGSQEKAKVMLHEFSYDLYKPETTLLFQFYTIGDRPEAAAIPDSIMLQSLCEEQRNRFVDKIESLDKVKYSRITETGIQIECIGKESVEIRQIALEVFGIIEEFSNEVDEIYA